MKNMNEENKKIVITTAKLMRHITDIWMITANKWRRNITEITIKVFTKRKNAFETTKSRREYHFIGKVYRSKDSLLNAINEYQNKNTK